MRGHRRGDLQYKRLVYAYEVQRRHRVTFLERIKWRRTAGRVKKFTIDQGRSRGLLPKRAIARLTM